MKHSDVSGAHPRASLVLLFIGPALCFLTAFLLIPLFQMGVISLFTYSPTKIWDPILTLANYRRFLAPQYLGVAWMTVKIGLLSTFACVILGYPLAYFLARADPRRLGIYMFLLITPLMVSGVIRIFGWIVILGQHRLINELLEILGLRGGAQLLYNVRAVVTGLIGQLLPFMVLPLMAAIENVHPSVEEAARNLGANGIQLFCRVILPLSLPGLVSGCLLVYTVAISSLVTPALMGGPRVRMLGNLVYDSVLTSLDWPFASSLAIILLVITGTMMILYIRIMRSFTGWRQRT